MFCVVIGGSGSGKSEFAENKAISLYKENNNIGDLIYIASMMPFGEETIKKINRHKNLRKGKGFKTIECFTDLKNIDIKNDSVVIFECISNIMSNEIFYYNKSYEYAVNEIELGIRNILKKASSLVVVTNNIFDDGILYNDDIALYIKSMADINIRISKFANSIIEVVCGIPIILK